MSSAKKSLRRDWPTREYANVYRSRCCNNDLGIDLYVKLFHVTFCVSLIQTVFSLQVREFNPENGLICSSN